MPKKRRLASGVSAGFTTLSEVLGSILSGRLLDERQTRTQEAILGRQQLGEFNTEASKLLDPAEVAKHGPQIMSQRYGNLKRRLPASMQQSVGADPDFASLDRPHDQRLADLTKEVSGITNPDDPTLTPEGLRKRAPGFRVKPDLEIPNLLPGSGGGDSGARVEDPGFTELEGLAEKLKTGLLAKEDRSPVKSINAQGQEETTYKTNRELAGIGTVQSERTPGQEGERQAAVTRATEQAKLDVAHDPRNVQGFKTRAEAEAYARQLGSNRADRQMGAGSFAPQYETKEEMGPDGSVIYRLIEKRSGTSSTIQGGQAPENITDGMRTAEAYANRAVAAHNIMTQLEPYIAQMGYLASLAQLKLDQINAPDSITDPIVRQYANATRAYINAGLGRPESGAQISETEFAGYQKTNAFTPGTDVNTLKQIQNNRRLTNQGLITRSGQRLGQRYTSVDELMMLPSAQGKTPQQVIREAEAAGYRVMR